MIFMCVAYRNKQKKEHREAARLAIEAHMHEAEIKKSQSLEDGKDKDGNIT